jgi:hypothetical protein
VQQQQPQAAPAETLTAEPAQEPPTAAPQDQQEGQSSSGQWVYTSQYGWIWMPYGSEYTYQPDQDGVYPYSYVYAPAYGWAWLASPWVWGWGALPYVGYYGSYYPWYGYGYGYQYPGYGSGNYGYGNGDGYANGNRSQYESPTHSKVAELQRRLSRAGYYRGSVDGILGPQTRRAIRAYESDHGYADAG